MASRTSIIIINWNGAAFLPQLLGSLQESKSPETILVDNASSDSSLQVASKFEQVRVIANPQNLGFGCAANQGIEESTMPYVLLMNSDVRALPGSVDLLERFLDDHADAAVAAPQLIFEDGKLQRSLRTFPTIPGLFLYLSFLDHLIASGYRLRAEEHQDTKEVDQPMGAVLLIRKEALQKTGLFDPRFFLYMEEVDLLERIKKDGWKIYYFPEAKMIHHAGGSSNQDWERSQTHFFESVIRYYKKRSGSGKVLLLRLSLSFALLLRSLALFLIAKFRQAFFYLKMSLRLWKTT